MKWFIINILNIALGVEVGVFKSWNKIINLSTQSSLKHFILYISFILFSNNWNIFLFLLDINF